MFYISNVLHLKRFTSQMFHISNVLHLKRFTSQTFYISNVSHLKRFTSQIFHISNVLHLRVHCVDECDALVLVTVPKPFTLGSHHLRTSTRVYDVMVGHLGLSVIRHTSKYQRQTGSTCCLPHMVKRGTSPAIS